MRGHLENKKSGAIFFMTTALSFMIIYSSIYGYAKYSAKNIVIQDIDQKIEMKTRAKTVGEALERNELVLENADFVTPHVDEKLTDGMTIKISRSFPVNLYSDGKLKRLYVTESRVSDVLDKESVQLSSLDEVKPPLNSKVIPGETILVTRIKEETMTVTLDVPFLTQQNMTFDLDPGDIELVKEGLNGKKEVVYKIRYENGQVVSKDIIDEKVLEAVVHRVVNKGKEKLFVTNRGKPYEFESHMIMESTAYDLSFESCGKYPDHPLYGITRTGTRARPGVIAVDPRIIPLGTTVYIESMGSGPDYGFAIAEDTGGAIKGYRVDLFIEERRQALQYGRRNVKVYVINEGVAEELYVGFGD